VPLQRCLTLFLIVRVSIFLRFSKLYKGIISLVRKRHCEVSSLPSVENIMSSKRSPVFEQLEALFTKKIAVIDGAMGTEIQRFKYEEEDYRGEEEFKDSHKDLKGNNDLLVLTKDKVIKDIHIASHFTSNLLVDEKNPSTMKGIY
jgi:hypothetical protein